MKVLNNGIFSKIRLKATSELLFKGLKKLGNAQSEFESLHDNYAARLLDIRECLEDDIYLLKDGSLGVCYEISGIYDEPLTNDELEEKFRTFFQGVREIATGIPSHLNPQNTVIHCVLSQRVATEPPQKIHNKNVYAYGDSIAGNLLQEEEKFVFSALRPRVKRFLLSIRYQPIGGSERSSVAQYFMNLFKGEDEFIEDFNQDYAKDLKQFVNALSQLENQIINNFSPRRLTSVELISHYQNLFHGGENSEVYDTKTDMNEAVYTPPIKENRNKGCIELGDQNQKEINVFHLEQFPSNYKIGPFRHFTESIPVDEFDLVWVFSHGRKDYSNDLKAKETWFGRSPKRVHEFEEYTHYKQNISSLRPHGVLSVRLITFVKDDDLENKLRGVGLDYLGGRIVREKEIPRHLFATSLPLNCNSVENKVKCRFKRMRLENALCFLPIYSGPNANEGTRWHISRSLTPARLDMLAGEGARIIILLGKTRSGKSVFSQLFDLEFFERYSNAIVRNIEIKTSCQKECDQFGGKIVRFSETELKSDPYSPFALDSCDIDDIESLHLIIKTAIVQKNQGIKTNAIHDEILKESLKLAYNTHFENLKNSKAFGAECDPHPIWPDIVAQMPTACNNLTASGVKGVEEAREELTRWSVNLYPTGQYGFLFSKHETRPRSKELERFLIYDLDGISDPVLRQLAAMMAYLKIKKDLAKLPKSTLKLFRIDEFGTLQNGEDEAQKINEEQTELLITTAAKYNVVTFIIDNNIKTFTQKPAGKTAWQKANIKGFLPITKAMYDAAREAWKDEFSEAEWQIIRSNKKEPQFRRSSIFIKSDHELHPWTGSLYIPLSPVMDALTTSSGSQTELYTNLRKEGLSEDSAIIHMAKQHPYGEGL